MRFYKEYLGQLIQRNGHKDCELKVRDIARVQELSTGRDGRVRVVKVKTRNGILTRPVRKLYPLERIIVNRFLHKSSFKETIKAKVPIPTGDGLIERFGTKPFPHLGRCTSREHSTAAPTECEKFAIGS
ncbi:DUF5641 domain-containing protein [Trichonephila inaurata madagascariensis]|uniref:DUF5641 domain-containing protein n=1 Tax=Trichonephila inaurata madagascariensis TaxID=2747483 RepID=A0A8X7CLC0_9ARAC|nr:DUF5641 domain-containing protein [Trichonephila inaurata madagascariensis]